MLQLIRHKRTIRDRLEALKNAISSSKVISPTYTTKFVFLCGANKSKSNISERRKALIEFSQRHLPHTQFFLAENMFATLQEEGHKGNLLDIEHEISQFADNIVLVLESPSAFAELGAFSHNKLRNKLIIINDSQFMSSESFINLGPLKAIEEVSGSNNIIYYKMKNDGVHRRDSIGDTYKQLYDLLKEPIHRRSKAISLTECNPALNFNKESAMFVHDLIYFTGPISHKELVEITTQIFGKYNFKIREHAAILGAFNTITRNKNGLYKSNINKPYYEYRFDSDKLISTFRNYMLRSAPNRIYGY